MVGERFTFFWGGVFSQWHICTFTVEGVSYNCAEQYMMAEKARLFGDQYHEHLIMGDPRPAYQKAMGRQVAGFNLERWNAVARQIVARGNRAKFDQNPQLKTLLLLTEGTTLVEASPRDSIWGIGLSKENPLAHDRATWKGTSWLGQILTDLRDEYLRDEHARVVAG